MSWAAKLPEQLVTDLLWPLLWTGSMERAAGAWERKHNANCLLWLLWETDKHWKEQLQKDRRRWEGGKIVKSKQCVRRSTMFIYRWKDRATEMMAGASPVWGCLRGGSYQYLSNDWESSKWGRLFSAVPSDRKKGLEHKLGCRILSEHQAALLHCLCVVERGPKLPGGCVVSSLEIFKSHLVVGLGILLWVAFWSRGWAEWALQTPAILNHSLVVWSMVSVLQIYITSSSRPLTSVRGIL